MSHTIPRQFFDANDVTHMNVKRELFWSRQRVVKAELVASSAVSYEFKFLPVNSIGSVNGTSIGSCNLNQNNSKYP